MNDPKLKVVITLDGKTYEAAIDSATAKTEKFGATASTSAAGLSQLYGSAKAVYGLLVAYGAVRIVKGFIDINAEFERLNVSLESIEGSSAKAKTAFAAIEQLAASTPFQLEQLTQGYIRLKAYGIDPMDGTYQAIIDQSAKLGGSQEQLEGVILAIGQAWAKQKLQGQEILQLVNQGVPVWEILAKVTGKNTNELQKLSEQGKLGRNVIKAFIAEMGSESLGAAARNIDTLGGRFSNLQDAISRAAKSLGESSGFNDMLKSAAAAMTDFIDSMTPKSTQQLGTFVEQQEQTIDRMLVRLDQVREQIYQRNVETGFYWLLPSKEELAAEERSIIDVIIGYSRNINDYFVKHPPKISVPLKPGTLIEDQGPSVNLSVYQDIIELMRSVDNEQEKLNDAIVQWNAMWNARLLPTETYIRLIKAATSADKEYTQALETRADLLRENRDAVQLYTDEVYTQLALLQGGIITNEQFSDRLATAQQGLTAVGKTGIDAFSELKAATKGWGDEFTNTMADATMKGKADFEDMANSIIRDTLRIMYYQSITRPVLESFGVITPAAPNALGNVFSAGNIIPFATGGVVSRPTYFPMSGGRMGVMGEAGPEAVMPLTRGANGKLGVQAVGQGSPSTVRVVLENHGGPKEAQQAQVSFDPQGMVINVLINDLRRGGPAASAISQTFGLQRSAF